MTKDISSIPTVGWDGHPDGPLVFLQDHEAYVSHLQAEVKRLKALRAESHVNFLDYSDLLHDVACSHNWVISDELRTRITETLNVFATPGQAPAYSYAAIRKERDALKSELTKARELLTDVAKTPWMYDVLGSVREYLANQSVPADKGPGEPEAIGTSRRDADERIVFDAIGDPHIKGGMAVYAARRP